MNNNWITVDEFQKESNEDYCWIVYKGRVVEAYHNHKQHFMASKYSDNRYLEECITCVQIIDRPHAPSKPDTEDNTNE